MLHGAGTLNSNPKTEVAIQAWGEAPGTARRVRAGLDVRGLGAFERAYAAVYSELVRRVGQSYSLDQLADAWRESDRWAPDVALDAARPTPPPRSTPLLVDLACARLQRSARDART
ncbi:MAG: hypothetical protein EXQ67_04120 [Thermoleophilia bacterium]|nr:hypothetical protein [Thermoleophilia bacterium]